MCIIRLTDNSFNSFNWMFDFDRCSTCIDNKLSSRVVPYVQKAGN